MGNVHFYNDLKNTEMTHVNMQQGYSCEVPSEDWIRSISEIVNNALNLQIW